MGLTMQDREYIQKLKDIHILEDVQEHLLDQTNGVILVTCADADQMYDIFRYQVEMQNGYRSDPRIHTLAWNGGAIRLPELSPANVINMSDILFMREIADAAALKNIHTIALYIHAPCGKTQSCGMTFQQSIYLLFQAKIRIKREIARAQVACFCHIDYGDLKKRTLFLNRQNFEKFQNFLN